MNVIHYWNQSSSVSTGTAQKQQTTSQVTSINTTFNQQMYDMLLGGTSSDSSLLNMFNSDIPSSLLDTSKLDSATQSKLSALQNNDMAKVLAAKISNSLPFSDLNYYTGISKNNQNNNSLDGLNSIIDLTIKKQIAEAKKQIDNLQKGSQMTLQDFINQQLGTDSQTSGSSGSTTSVSSSTMSPIQSDSVDMFTSNIRDQLQAASQKFNLSLADLQQKIFTPATQ